MIPRLLTIVLSLLLGIVPAAAQQALTLAEAQAEARAHAPEAAELEALVQGAEAIAAQASRRFRQSPEVSGTYFNGALTGRSEETAWSVGAKWPVDVSGSWTSRGASAGALWGLRRGAASSRLTTMHNPVCRRIKVPSGFGHS